MVVVVAVAAAAEVAGAREGERDHHGNEGNRITALCPSGMREARKDCENEVNFTGACPTHGDKFEHVPTTAFYWERSSAQRQIN